MKVHKEIVWNKGVNPNENGDYLLAMWTDGKCYDILTVSYTTEYGWNTCDTSCSYGWGQKPRDKDYVWAELPF